VSTPVEEMNFVGVAAVVTLSSEQLQNPKARIAAMICGVFILIGLLVIQSPIVHSE
jgi:hypothetical protein